MPQCIKLIFWVSGTKVWLPKWNDYSNKIIRKLLFIASLGQNSSGTLHWGTIPLSVITPAVAVLPVRHDQRCVSVCVVQGPVARCAPSWTRTPSSWPFPQTFSDPSAPTVTRTRRAYRDYRPPDARTHSAARCADRWLSDRDWDSSCLLRFVARACDETAVSCARRARGAVPLRHIDRVVFIQTQQYRGSF